MMSIGVRELRQHASRWLARVKAGESITITDRGDPVARLVPITSNQGLDRLLAEGMARPAEGDLLEVLARSGGPTEGPSVSDRLESLRADER